LLHAAGIDPASPQGQQALRANIEKQNYLAPIEEREGSVERDARTNAVIGVNPKTTTGGVNLYDPQGQFTGQAIAPGAAQAIEQSEKAATLGQTAGKYSILPTAGGGNTVVGGPINQGTPQGSQPPGIAQPSGLQAPRVGGSARNSPPVPPGWES